MTSKTIRVALVAAACLGLVGATRLTILGTTPTMATSDGTDDGQHSVKELIQQSGYMVAIG